MNNTYHNIWKSNAPPLAREKPSSRQKAKGKRQKAEFLHPLVQDFFPHFGGNVRRTKGGTLTFNLSTLTLSGWGWPLLHFRDGPEESIQCSVAVSSRKACDTACILHTQISSVYLCAHSVTSVVKRKRNHGEPRSSHRERRVILYTLNKNRVDRYNCIPNGLGPAGGSVVFSHSFQ